MSATGHYTMLGLPVRVVQTGDAELDGRGAFFRIVTGGNRLCAFRSAQLEAWIYVDRSQDRTPQIVVDDRTFSMSAELYNGKPLWARRSGGNIFYSAAYGEWIYFGSVGEPHAEQKLDGTWEGDGWWALGTDDPGPDWSPDFSARGVYIDEERAAPDIRWTWPRWQWNAERSGNSVEPYGVYTPEDQDDDETRVFLIGIRCWKNEARSLYASFYGTSYEYRDENGTATLTKQEGGSAWSSDWNHPVGSGVVWHEMPDEPITGQNATVSRNWYEWDGERFVQQSIQHSIPFWGCVASGRRRVCRMGEVGQWR